MEQMFFILILKFVQLLRAILIPPLIAVAWPFSAKLRQRLAFESLNFDFKKMSYKDAGVEAHVAFEVSSEGEFEQVRPLLDFYLDAGKRVELIYSSPSLESKISTLASEYENLRVLRLPIASYFFFQIKFLRTQNLQAWITAPKLILCRYDFYPELLLYGSRREVRFCLVSATVKNKNVKSWWLIAIYKLFSFILTATPQDLTRLQEMNLENSVVDFFEFRIPQILKRLGESSVKLDKYKEFISWLTEVERNKRIIVGSAWDIETLIFKDSSFQESIKNNQSRVVVVPHQFGGNFEKVLAENSGLPVHVFKGGDFSAFIVNVRSAPGIVVLQVKGVLLELYSFFGHSLVGGGHGRSIHSVLEPFLAGCHVYCGPKVQRSTEYDFIKASSSEDITVISELTDFWQLYSKIPKKDLVASRKSLAEKVSLEFPKKILKLDEGVSL